MTNYNEIVRRYEEATEDVREAVEELRLASIAYGYEDGRKDARLREISETMITPEMQAGLRQSKRDEIIAKAKADVDRLKPKDPHEFIVNKSKRTIVALIRDLMNGEVYDRGIAKCDPSDCFNVHIGKAISLRRAMGIDVPSEYFNAPQPTVVQVGDVVAGSGGYSHFYSAKRAFTISGRGGDGSYHYEEDTGDWMYADNIGIIIDDSRE